MASRTPSSSSSPSGGSQPSRRFWTRLPDLVFFVLFAVAGVSIIFLAVAIVGVLSYDSSSTITQLGFRFLVGRTWNPAEGVYGVLPFVYGTLITSAVALVIAVPLALGSSIFLTTQAPQWLRRPVGTAIELLAAIPSVIYGFWGIFVLEPYMRTTVEPGLHETLGWTGAFTGTPIGTDMLTASVILAIMIIPTVAAVSRDSLSAVPAAQREAALSLGATQWESTRFAMIPYARAGIVGGVILGLGRAMGETMAVTMTIGNRDVIPTSLFSQGQTIASLIANELLSNTGPLQYSAILEAGLVLLGISLAVNVVARLLTWKVLRISGGIIE